MFLMAWSGRFKDLSRAKQHGKTRSMKQEQEILK